LLDSGTASFQLCESQLELLDFDSFDRDLGFGRPELALRLGNIELADHAGFPLIQSLVPRHDTLWHLPLSLDLHQFHFLLLDLQLEAIDFVGELVIEPFQHSRGKQDLALRLVALPSRNHVLLEELFGSIVVVHGQFELDSQLAN
jgi:hypothetical protein